MKIKWSSKQEEVAGRKLTKKQTHNLKVEGRVMEQLNELKKSNGPFTSEADIEKYLSDDSISMKEKHKRMKMEVQYARDTSLSIPKCNPLFRIRTFKQVGKKARDLSGHDYGENLKQVISKKLAACGKEVTVSDFIGTLDTLV